MPVKLHSHKQESDILLQINVRTCDEHDIHVHIDITPDNIKQFVNLSKVAMYSLDKIIGMYEDELK